MQEQCREQAVANYQEQITQLKKGESDLLLQLEVLRSTHEVLVVCHNQALHTIRDHEEEIDRLYAELSAARSARPLLEHVDDECEDLPIAPPRKCAVEVCGAIEGKIHSDGKMHTFAKPENCKGICINCIRKRGSDKRWDPRE